MSLVAKASGKPGPDPGAYKPRQKKVWMAERALALLSELSAESQMPNGRFITELIAEKTGTPVEELLRDMNQEALSETA